MARDYIAFSFWTCRFIIREANLANSMVKKRPKTFIACHTIQNSIRTQDIREYLFRCL